MHVPHGAGGERLSAVAAPPEQVGVGAVDIDGRELVEQGLANQRRDQGDVGGIGFDRDRRMLAAIAQCFQQAFEISRHRVACRIANPTPLNLRDPRGKGFRIGGLGETPISQARLSAQSGFAPHHAIGDPTAVNSPIYACHDRVPFRFCEWLL